MCEFGGWLFGIGFVVGLVLADDLAQGQAEAFFAQGALFGDAPDVFVVAALEVDHAGDVV